MSLELTKQLVEFILAKCYFELEVILGELDIDSSYSLYIKLVDLFDWNPDFGEECLLRPQKYLKAFEEAIQASQSKVLLVHEHSERLRVKAKVQVRFTALPLTPWTFFERIPTSSSLGKLVSLRGTVIRTGSLKMQEFCKEWQCTRCKTRQTTFVDDYQYGLIGKPIFCTGAVDGVACKNVKFEEFQTCDGEDKKKHVDYQEIKMQELTSVLEIGAVPRSIVVLLRDDLVDRCRAGDDVIITGILGCRMKTPLKADSSRLDGELFLQASSIQATASKESYTNSNSNDSANSSTAATFNLFRDYWKGFAENEWEGRAGIVDSFCPQMHGMFLVKLATLMTVIGGSSNAEEDEDADNENRVEHASTVNDNNNNNNQEVKGARKSRREGHLLLVGDPGTGKSQFLVNSARLVDRSVMTTGSGSTMAGLTCAAVKDGSGWQLEAGALVMADRGLCCIDEFNALRPQDRTAIHEAMEQQTLSVAKAGLVCKLNTRCSILAACNVKGELEEGKTISANLALASPLLSRFDLIFLLLDRNRRDNWDSELCDRLLRITSTDNNDTTRRADLWDFDRLKLYVSFIRFELNPNLSAIAELVLSKYYQLQRRSDSLLSARTTVRLLESLVRLAQSHAKLMFHAEVTLRDAVSAIILVEASLTSTRTVEPIISDLQAASPTDFESLYSSFERDLLLKLEINPNNLVEDDDNDEMENESFDHLLNEIDMDTSNSNSNSSSYPGTLVK